MRTGTFGCDVCRCFRLPSNFCALLSVGAPVRVSDGNLTFW